MLYQFELNFFKLVHTYIVTQHIYIPLSLNYVFLIFVERDVAQWLDRSALPMSLPAAWVRNSLGARFSDKYHVSPLQHWDILVSMLCPWARHPTLKCFTSLRCNWVPGTEMVIIVRQITSTTCRQCCMLPGEVKWYRNEQVQWPGIIMI